jgi:gliding motility-associated lipoprotein GldJ
MKYLFMILTGFGLILGSSSCGNKGERSATTGWKYNDQEWGGFEKLDYEGQATGPNLVPIEGGTFLMGLTEEDVTYEWNNEPRRVTVSSFYMDETEVANIDYREFVYWTKKAYGASYPQVVTDILPDTLVWREELAYNEPLVETYFRHPSFDDYPVVGVNWYQARKYATWRTDRVNEMILIERGIFNPNPDQIDSDVFTTDAYLARQYDGNVRKNLPDIATGGERPVKFEDGIMLPKYRLPTEAEWEYAALALIGNQVTAKDELITDRRIYPWNDNTARYKRNDKYQGQMLANFKRSRGDYMGIAGKLNDNAPFPASVVSFYPNDFGLYNMAGNVSEWTEDLYRPTTSMTLRDVENHDLNPFRGNKFQSVVLDENGSAAPKDSLGHLRYRDVTDEEASKRDNYRRGDVSDFWDGDSLSTALYAYGVHTLINDSVRVVKGGSWADRLFWLSPGSRRFLNEQSASRTVGFRCAMSRMGGASMNEVSGGLEFGGQNKKQVKRRYK